MTTENGNTSAQTVVETVNELTVNVYGNDYAYKGIIVSIFKKMRGEVRCVVEDASGRLFIHNATQLRLTSHQLWDKRKWIDND